MKDKSSDKCLLVVTAKNNKIVLPLVGYLHYLHFNINITHFFHKHFSQTRNSLFAVTVLMEGIKSEHGYDMLQRLLPVPLPHAPPTKTVYTQPEHYKLVHIFVKRHSLSFFSCYKN